MNREQLKLSATFFNGLAVAIAAVGVFQTILNASLLIPPLTLMRALVCLLVSILLHLTGVAILGGPSDE